jgi:hypothetical protein
MIVHMDMQERARLAVDELEHFAERPAADGRAGMRILNVILVGDPVPLLTQEQYAIPSVRSAARKKPHALQRKRMGPREVRADFLDQGLQQSNVDGHRSSRACSA